jgi:AGCS family alanine or glycine:cation symporter
MTALVIVITGTWRVNGEISVAGADLMEGADSPTVVQPIEQGTYVHIRGKTTIGEGDDAVNWVEVIGLVDRDTYAESVVTGWVQADHMADRMGIPITSLAFREVIGWFPYLLSIAVLLFAFSTMISWSYYGEQGVVYLFGRNKWVILTYQLVFCMCVVIGAAASLGNILRLSDAMIFAMVLPNLVGMYILLPVVKQELANYLDHVRAVRAGDVTVK